MTHKNLGTSPKEEAEDYAKIPIRRVPQYSMDISDTPSREPISHIIEFWINGEWIEPVSREYQDRAERYEKLATSTQVLLNLSMNEIKTLNEKVEQLEEKIWELTKENLGKY